MLERRVSPSSGVACNSVDALSQYRELRPDFTLIIFIYSLRYVLSNAKDLGALAVGVYEDGQLRFSGKVGSGFTGAIRKELLDRTGAAREPTSRRSTRRRPGLPRPLGRRPRGSRGSGRSS